jgi:hypothetical protein
MTLEEFHTRLSGICQGHVANARSIMAAYEAELKALFKDVEASDIEGEAVAGIAEVVIKKMQAELEGIGS